MDIAEELADRAGRLSSTERPPTPPVHTFVGDASRWPTTSPHGWSSWSSTRLDLAASIASRRRRRGRGRVALQVLADLVDDDHLGAVLRLSPAGPALPPAQRPGMTARCRRGTATARWPTCGSSTAPRCSPARAAPATWPTSGPTSSRSSAPDGGDTTRAMGWRDPRDDVTLWWKLAGRNKRTIAARPQGPGRPRPACAGCSTPPTCWSRTSGRARSSGSASAPTTCSPATRARHHPGHRLRPGRPVRRPARASPPWPRRMSGFAAINGEPDGGPLLPPIALTDEVTALVAAFATHGRRALRRRPGRRRQPARVAVPAHGPADLGLRADSATSSRGSARASPTRCPAAPTAAPTASGWPSRTSAESVAARVMDLIGVGDDARFATFAGRVDHREEIDERLADWIGRPRPATTCSPRSRRPTPRPRRCTTWPTSPTTRTIVARGVDRRRRRHPDAGPHRPAVGHPGPPPLGRPPARRRHRRGPRRARRNRAARALPLIAAASSASLQCDRDLDAVLAPFAGGVEGAAPARPARRSRRRGPGSSDSPAQNVWPGSVSAIRRRTRSMVQMAPFSGVSSSSTANRRRRCGRRCRPRGASRPGRRRRRRRRWATDVRQRPVDHLDQADGQAAAVLGGQPRSASRAWP